MTKLDKPTRDQIALEALIALISNVDRTRFTDPDVAKFCRIAYDFADGLLGESVRPAEVDEPEVDVVVIDTDAEPDVDKESKAARTKRINAGALLIYNAYPRKVAKVQAVRSIAKVLMADFDPLDLLRRTKAYAATNPHNGLPARHADNFCPYPSTWFNQRRFEDDAFDEGAVEGVTKNRFLTDGEDE